MRTLLGVVVLATTVWMSAPCAAQVGGVPSEILSAKQALTAEQKKTLAAAVDDVADRFAQGDLGTVVESRNRLIELVKNPLAGEVFRREFAVILVQRFRPLTKEKQAFRATNAFIVARFLGTSDAIDFLLENIDPESQPDVALRISAAAQLPKAIAAAPLSPPQLDAQAKKIAKAARTETNWMVISHELDAVGDMLRPKTLPTAQAEAIAQSESGIINDLADRTLKGGSPELVLALQRALLVVRNQVDVPVSARVLDAIAPSLERITAAKESMPAEFAARPELASAFKGVVNTAEVLQNRRRSAGAATR